MGSPARRLWTGSTGVSFDINVVFIARKLSLVTNFCCTEVGFQWASTECTYTLYRSYNSRRKSWGRQMVHVFFFPSPPPVQWWVAPSQLGDNTATLFPRGSVNENYWITTIAWGNKLEKRETVKFLHHWLHIRFRDSIFSCRVEWSWFLWIVCWILRNIGSQKPVDDIRTLLLVVSLIGES